MRVLSEYDVETIDGLSERGSTFLGAMLGIFPVAPFVYLSGLQLLGDTHLQGFLGVTLALVAVLVLAGFASLVAVPGGILLISPVWWLFARGHDRPSKNDLDSSTAIATAAAACGVGVLVGGLAYVLAQAV